jgi:hypothetical protein
MTNLDPDFIATLQRLSDRAMQYARDGMIEHAEDVLHRMVRLSTDAQIAAASRSPQDTAAVGSPGEPS